MSVAARPGSPRSPRPTRRAAMVLLAVLVVVVLGALMGTIALEQSSMTATNARLSLQRRAARALAWSGLQGVLCEIEQSRDGLLAGQSPDITPEWTLFESGPTFGRIRLRAIGVEDGEEGPTIESESAKLNLNASTPEMLARLAGLGAERGAAAHGLAASGGGGGGIASVEDLRLAGIDPADEAGMLGGVPLERVATAYSLDPELRAGDGSGAERARWDAAAGALDRRTVGDRSVEEVIERLSGAGIDLASADATAAALLSLGIDSAVWSAVWDALAFSDTGREGLVDICRAPEAVLACVPGFEGRAGEIVAARSRLGADRTRTQAWPLESGIVTREEMAAALPWIATRSLFWRVRVAGEIVRTEEQTGEERIVASVVFDAVIDASGDRARVAYLRDSSFGDAAPGIGAMLALESEQQPRQGEDPLIIDSGDGLEVPAGVDIVDAAGEDGAPRTDPIDSGATQDPASGDASPVDAGRSGGKVRGRWTSGRD